MQLNAERLRFEQEENNGDFVWHLPPSFEDDLLAGTKVQEMTAKYCSKWMPPSPNLKFVRTYGLSFFYLKKQKKQFTLIGSDSLYCHLITLYLIATTPLLKILVYKVDYTVF